MANKILLENQQQLNKLDYELNKKLKEKLNKQTDIDKKEKEIIENMSARIFNEITNNINKINFLKKN